MGEPIAYHISFATYGTRLHGDERGTVDDEHNVPGTEYLQHDEALRNHREGRLKHPPTTLDAKMRSAVDAAICEVC